MREASGWIKAGGGRIRKEIFSILISAFCALCCVNPAGAQTANSTFTITANCTVVTPGDPIYSTFTITVSFNYAPAPVWISPAGAPASPTGYTLNQRPKAWFYANDQNNDQLDNWRLVIADDAGFTTNVSTYQFSVSAAGWTPASSPLAQGASFYYTPQADITKTYHYMKAMVKDYNVLGADGSDRTVWGSSPVREIYINPFAWTNPTITAGLSIIRQVHFTDLRTVIDNLRQFRGLSTCSWTDTLTPGAIPIRKTHMDQMRQCLDDALFTVGESTGTATWTDGSLAAGSSLIRAVHITELRTRCATP